MSIHPSLKPSRTRLRSVRKRWERFKRLQEKDKRSKIVFGMPKERNIKFKVKKKEKEKKVNLVQDALLPSELKIEKKKSKDTDVKRR